MKRRALSMVLTLVMALGLAAPALAYQTPDFSDLPADNWAYGPVMRMADQGYIQGTGGGMFSPTMKVSAAQFLTLVGRIVFPETTVGANDTWYGPYVAAAQDNGLLTGTLVDVNNVEAEITRYDMAVILRSAAKKLGVAEKAAQSSEVTDYLDISNRYTDAVLAVYGMGLIRGDQAGNFNGGNTMMRAEVATVIMRLKKAPEEQVKAEKEEAERKAAEAQAAYEASRTGEYVTVKFYGYVKYELPNAPVGLYFKDGRLLGQTVSDEKGNWSMDITLDKADYSFTEAWYYAALIGRVTAEKYGREYTFETNLEFAKPKSIMDRTVNFQSGFIATADIVE